MMASNFHYIVAGLPDLLLDFESRLFDFRLLKDAIQVQLAPEDKRWTDWLEFGLQPSQLSSHFYRAAAKAQNSFIRNYFGFDLQLRNIMAAVSARKAGLDPASAVIGNDELAQALRQSKANDFGLKNQNDTATRLFSILETDNILEREQRLDKFRWEKANEICTFHYFDIDVVLCFLLKASTVERWMLLDKTRGQGLFKALVQEIKGGYTTEHI